MCAFKVGKEAEGGDKQRDRQIDRHREREREIEKVYSQESGSNVFYAVCPYEFPKTCTADLCITFCNILVCACGIQTPT